MTLNINQLWDYSQPALSKERFRVALASASPEDALILTTQIARTYGMRQDFATARRILAEIAPQIAQATAEPQVRYWLELGRTYASAMHFPESQTDAATAQARAAFTHAYRLAQAATLDYLAIDALHMHVFVETEPAAQLQWNLEAVAYLEASQQPEAKKWEASLRHNLGYTLQQQKRYEEAISQYELSHEAHRRNGNTGGERIARWMIAATYRAMGRLADALALQLELEQAHAADGDTDPYVFEELAALYQALGDEVRAQHYATLLATANGNNP
jgi:tetratricopeptide (TPR) repeat protein